MQSSPANDVRAPAPPIACPPPVKGVWDPQRGVYILDEADFADVIQDEVRQAWRRQALDPKPFVDWQPASPLRAIRLPFGLGGRDALSGRA